MVFFLMKFIIFVVGSQYFAFNFSILLCAIWRENNSGNQLKNSPCIITFPHYAKKLSGKSSSVKKLSPFYTQSSENKCCKNLPKIQKLALSWLRCFLIRRFFVHLLRVLSLLQIQSWICSLVHVSASLAVMAVVRPVPSV